MKPFIITIARQYGSGGRTVGKMLAEKLGVHYYDREIIMCAAEEHGLNPRVFEDEKLKRDFWSRIRGGRTAVPPESAGFTGDDNLFNFQAQTIKRIADEGPSVIIGRCADYILRDRPDVARVFVFAPDDFCLREAMKVNSLPEHEVVRLIAKTDDYRAKFYKYHTGQEWKDARNYDLALNSARLGFDGTVEAILSYLEVRSRFQP